MFFQETFILREARFVLTEPLWKLGVVVAKPELDDIEFFFGRDRDAVEDACLLGREERFPDDAIDHQSPLLLQDVGLDLERDTTAFAIVGILPRRKDIVAHQEKHTVL